jgi:hypothetical protein
MVFWALLMKRFGDMFGDIEDLGQTVDTIDERPKNIA